MLQMNVARFSRTGGGDVRLNDLSLPSPHSDRMIGIASSYADYMQLIVRYCNHLLIRSVNNRIVSVNEHPNPNDFHTVTIWWIGESVADYKWNSDWRPS